MTINLSVALQPEGFSASLIALQTHLQGFLAEYEDKVAQARTQLAHVEALLGSLPSSEPTPAIKKKEVVVAPIAPAVPTEPVVPTPPVVTAEAVAPTSTRGRKPKALVALPVETPVVAGKGKGRGHRRGSLDMRPAYEGLTLTEAIEKVLNDRFGQAVNADDVVNILYGEVTESVFRVAKERVTKNLSKGKGEGIWKRVPSQLGYYTISLEDLKTIPTSTIKRGRAASVKTEIEKAAKPAKAAKEPKAPKSPKAPKMSKVDLPSPNLVTEIKATKVSKAIAKKAEAAVKSEQPKRSGRMSSLVMRPLYSGNTLTDAIEKVLQERKGEFVNADSVVKALYGDLSIENFRQAKDRVTKNLSKGKLDGKWERVPNQLGYYTLSMSAVKA
jgi:hypothetical protein